MADTHAYDVNKLFSMRGQICVVTGGGTGIGLMITQALAANGAKVYIVGRRLETLLNTAQTHTPNGRGGEIVPLGPCDVTKKDQLEKTVQDLGQREKYINLLVCNAGIAGPKAEPDQTNADDQKTKLWQNESVEEWVSTATRKSSMHFQNPCLLLFPKNQTYSTDVTSVYFTTVAFLPLLQAGIEPNGPLPKFGPNVITTSSMSGLMRHAQGHFSYNAAKAATVHLTKLMSAEFQKLSIRVNSIAPGYFPSEMTDRNKTSDDRQKSEFPQEKIEGYGHVPLMRPGREEEMGMTALFLAKNEYVNGQILAVDGGVLNVVSGS